jgi:hypothetical protein
MSNSNQQALGVITNVALRAGFMGVKTRSYSLVITDRQILFARMTTAQMKELSHQANPGKGFVGQMGTGNQVFGLLIEQYTTMSPEQILAEHKDNFAIDRSTISKVKIKSSTGGESGVTTDTLVIKTSDKTYKVTLMSVEQARRVLQQTGLLAA